MSEEQIIDEMEIRLGFIILELTESKEIKTCSPHLPAFLGYDKSSLSNLNAEKIFSKETYEDLFGQSPFSLYSREVINYRGYMVNDGGQEFLTQISGYYKEVGNNSPGSFRLMIQKLTFDNSSAPNTGHIRENLKAHEIVNRYISPALFEKAKFTVKSGLNNIPDEVRYLTFLFADIVSFTSFAENKNPAEVMETLNLSIGAATSTILHWNGIMDKIMGDSIMAIFENPLDAVISAVEIQKEFRMFNQMRSLQNLETLDIRIGINSGNCIQGSIGMDKYMEWTVIGDAVNSASRLEKNCRTGSILVSEETLKYIKDQIHISEMVDVSLRGKKNILKAYYIDRVLVRGEDMETIEVGIDDAFAL
jgi:class 3 adenylate cyclase